MPVPTSFDDISETSTSNSPLGSETVGTEANEYFQIAFAFIKMLRDGQLKPTAPVDMNAQKVTNIAAGTLSPTSKDVVRGDQVYKVGEVRMWHGAVADIATTWGAGWQLADGTNSTADLRDRFVVGAGTTYTTGNTGGANTVALATANMPAHNHAVTDPGHSHTPVDPGHGHAVNDPGHAHSITVHAQEQPQSGTTTPCWTNSENGFTSPAFSNISIFGAVTGIGIAPNFAGISTQNTGSGTAHENRPPYYALCFIEYTGQGA